MKRRRRPSSGVPRELQAFAAQLPAFRNYLAPLTAFVKSVQPQLRGLPEFMRVAAVMKRKVDAYDQRHFRLFKVEFGDWKGLLLAKANGLPRRQTKGAPRLKMPPELASLSQDQYREIVRLFDRKWQKYMATPIQQWPEPLAHGRPKARLTEDQERAWRGLKRENSANSKSMTVARQDKAKARRLRYAARKSGFLKKVER